MFETLLAVKGGAWRVLHLREHLERLAVSAKGLGLSETLRVAALEEAVVRTVEKAGEELEGERLRVRVTVTGGDLNMLGRARSGAQGAYPPAPSLGEGVCGADILLGHATGDARAADIGEVNTQVSREPANGRRGEHLAGRRLHAGHAPDDGAVILGPLVLLGRT